MKIESFEFNLFGEKTYIVWDETTRESVVIDPGMSNDFENDKLTNFIIQNNLKLKYILYTHLHIDHTLGHEFVKSTFNIPTLAHIEDVGLGESREIQAQMFRLRTHKLDSLRIDTPISYNSTISIGDESITVLHIPGHTQGSVAYYNSKSNFVITGDALFCGSIGRTDLPGGNYSQLISSIQNKLLTLPDNTCVYPGHGPMTTIIREKQSNPFL